MRQQIGKPADAVRSLIRRVAEASARGRDTGRHVTRYVMYRQLAAVAAQQGFGRGRDEVTLSVSGSLSLCDAMHLADTKVVEVDYPDVDLLDLGFEDETFDYVVADQVLEHVGGDPFEAMRESFRVTRAGGVVVHTTCFMNPIHDRPHDYWRFSSDALRLMSQEYGETIECGAWGNRSVWILEELGLRYTPVPHRPGHPLHRLAVANNPNWPVVTWIVARRF